MAVFGRRQFFAEKGIGRMQENTITQLPDPLIVAAAIGAEVSHTHQHVNGLVTTEARALQGTTV